MTYPKPQLHSRQRWHAGAATALLATAATVACSMAATATPASADSTTSTTVPPAVTTVPAWGNRLGNIKAKAAAEIAERITSLNNEIALVKGKAFLGADGTSLVAEMEADITGLQALGVKIAGDTTVSAALADSDLIFTQFRVYRLMLPVASDVIDVDAVTNVDVPDLDKAITWLQGQENSTNQGVLGPLVANMQSQVQIATSALSGLSAQLLGYTPADWNANHGLLNGPAADVRIADRAVGTAKNDLQEGYKYLQHHHTPPTTTTTLPTTTTSTSTTTTSVPATTTTTSGNLAAIQAWAAKMISQRLASLESAIKKVQGESYLGSDGASLVTEMQTDISGLEALNTKIAADTTAAEAQADANLIFSDYRVYDLVLNVVRDVSAVDYVDNVKLPAIGKEITYLQGKENTTTQAVLVPLVTNMQLQVTTATGATSGLSAELLGYTAAQWDANHRLLAGANANIYVSQRAVQTAAKDYSRAEDYLRSLHHHHR